MNGRRSAAIVTVGTELVRGISVDTNTAEIAHVLTGAGFDVGEAVSVGDDTEALSAVLSRLTPSCDLVVVTGGLGPTHDDVTRHAASRALGLPLVRDPAIAAALSSVVARHRDARSADQVLAQADVLRGARVLPALVGTAPGQVVATPGGTLVLLPGPPREMRPMLDSLATEWGGGSGSTVVIRTHGVPESDLQHIAQDVLEAREDIDLTLLARPGDVAVVLFDRGAGAVGLGRAADAIAERIGDAVYSTDGASMPETVVRAATDAAVIVAAAESCTGGLIGAAITSVPGASGVFAGSAVAYSNAAKTALLGVDPGLISACGAVSDAVAKAMAAGARDTMGADHAIAVTGVAGPDGGSAEKPVGTVWFAVAGPDGCEAYLRRFTGDREHVRARATMTALDLLRRALARY